MRWPRELGAPLPVGSGAGLAVALVVPRLGGPGGTEGHVWALARFLAEGGHRVTVHAQRIELPPRATGSGVDLRRVAAPGRPALERAARSAAREGRVVEVFDRIGGGHVYRAGGGAHGAWMASRPGRITGFLAMLSGSDRRELEDERRALEEARLVICNSELAAADLRRWYPWVEGRLRLVRNGVDPRRFRPCAERRGSARRALGATEGARVVLFLGSGFRRKGLDEAAGAFGRVASGGDRFVVAGRDAHPAAARARLARRLGDRLVWLGPVTAPERWLAGADVAILPTRYDPSSNSTLEAMATGVAAITSARDGASELLPPELVVRDPADPGALADVLDFALADSATLGQECHRRASPWTAARAGADTLAILREVAHE